MASGKIGNVGNVKTYNYYSSQATTFEHNFSNYCQFIIVANHIDSQNHTRGNGLWYGVTAANDNQCNIIQIDASTSNPTSVTITSKKATITTSLAYVRVSVIEIPF